VVVEVEAVVEPKVATPAVGDRVNAATVFGAKIIEPSG
jgi:hypothetical protein